SVQPLLSGENLKSPLSPRVQQKLAASRRQLHAAGVVRIKLWNLDGRIVYSDKRDLVGRRFPLASDLAEAADGHVMSDVSDLKEAENVEDHGFGRLLEVYVPLRSSHGRVGGVFE